MATKKNTDKCRLNALRHGILGRLVTDYDKAAYNCILKEFEEELKPEAMLERIMVERMAVHYLRLFRVAKAEFEYINERLHPRITALNPGTQSFEGRVFEEGYKADLSSEDVEHLVNKYMRYETAIENRFYKAIREYNKLQATSESE